ncbi:MAG: hypothetical protein LBV41_10195 [Cytophagaceae bacterium]|jgi:hypothetical protein|nr:hypothetical protein [Cytophagaceae bacterium]
MNRNQLTEYIQHPARLNEQSLSELHDVLVEYPFFQSARMLWIKNLHNLDHIKYNSELKLAAAHLSNREKLFFLINDYGFDTKAEEKEEVKLQTKTEAPASSSYFDVDDTIELSTGRIIDFSEQKREAPDEKPETEPAVFVLPSADLLDYERGVNTGFNISDLVSATDEEFQSFSAWLKMMRSNKTALPDKHPEKKESPKQNKNMMLIDNFLQKGNVERIKMKVEKTENYIEDFSIKSLRENDDLMTETLADIYIRQKLFSKAINIFERLSLKFPEKSIYFARRIKEVEELIN